MLLVKAYKQKMCYSLHLSDLVINTHHQHHLSGRTLPTIYGDSLPRLPSSLPITGVPPKRPPKPYWLRQKAQSPRNRVRSLCSPYSDSDKSHSTLDEDCLVESDSLYGDCQDIAENTLLAKNHTILWKMRFLHTELKHNEEVYLKIENKLKSTLSSSGVEKLQSHNEDIEKISALVLSLLRRLCRVEREMREDVNEAKCELMKKRDKLLHQLEDAKELKKCIDKRTINIVKLIQANLDESFAEQFERFVDVKIKLIAQIKMAEENLRQQTNCQ